MCPASLSSKQVEKAPDVDESVADQQQGTFLLPYTFCSGVQEYDLEQELHLLSHTSYALTLMLYMEVMI